MKKSEYILREWNKAIICYERLSIRTAKELYIKMVNSSGSKYNQYREKLITGTLYLIPNFIRHSILPYLHGNSYDMNDIINICNEQWINIIDSGRLLEVDFFNQLFNESFYTNLSLGLVPEYDFNNMFDVNCYFFVDALIWYINESYNNKDVSYESFLKYLDNYITSSGEKVYDVCPCRDTLSVYNYIRYCYDYLNKNGLFNRKISLRQIKLLKNVIIDSIYNIDYNICNNLSSDDFMNYLNSVLEDDILSIIFNDIKLKGKEKEILKYRFGTHDGFYRTCEKVGEIFDMTKAGVDISIKRSIRKIRKKGNNVMSLIKDYLYD